MRVLLISSNQTRSLIPVPPIGIAYLASAVKARGHDFRVVDLCFSVDPEMDLSRELAAFQPDLIGISVRNFAFNKMRKSELMLAREMAVICRDLRPGAEVILGGAGFSYDPSGCLRYCGLQYGIVGDGEIALLAVLDRMADGVEIGDVPGVVEAVDNGPSSCAPVDDLDAYPLTDIGFYDKAYLGWAMARSPYPSMKVFNIQTRRGCPNRCLNCKVSDYAGSRLRRKSPRLVVEELDLLHNTWGADRFFLVDDLFNQDLEHLASLCGALVRMKWSPRWSCITCNNFENITPDVLGLMKEAGCEAVILDSTTAADRMLQVVGKTFTSEDLTKAAEAVAAAGLSPFFHLTIGFPGETAETARESLRIMERLGARTLPVILGTAVYPGTRLDMLTAGQRIPCANPGTPDLYISPDLDPAELGHMLWEYRQRHPDWFFGSVFSAAQDWINENLYGGAYGTGKSLLLP